MNCKDCKERNAAANEPVPYIVHEAAMARAERNTKRIWIACIILAVIVFASNALWLWAWQSYDYTGEEYTYTQDGKGINVIGDSNEVRNGAETNDPSSHED